MASLTAHLTSGTAAHGRLRFHRDCPRCQAERLQGSLGGDAIAPRRTQAALAAGVLAFSAAAPPAAALGAPNQTQQGTTALGEQDQAQEGTTAPGSEEPGLESEFDPGGDDTLDQDTAPLPGGDEGDDGAGAPVETEPDQDPEGRALLDPPPVEPSPPTDPLGAPEPEPAPSVPAAPGPPPTAAPAPGPTPSTEVEQPTGRDAGERSVKRKAPKRTAEPQSSGPVPATPLPAAQPAPAPSAPTGPAESVAVSQPAAPAQGGPVTGRAYTVQPGDNLWLIARRLLGPDASAGQLARQVNRLWQLNQGRIGTGDPDMLHVGTVLRLA